MVTLGPLVTLGPKILPAPVKALYNNAHQLEDVVHEKERINHEAGRRDMCIKSLEKKIYNNGTDFTFYWKLHAEN